MRIVDYEAKYAYEIVELWRNSKRHALGDYTEKHGFEDMLQYLTKVMVVEQKVFLGFKNDRLIGFLALHNEWIEQLYIDVHHLNFGFGSQFMSLAKRLSPQFLQAYTFERNQPARQFYLKHGFVAAKFGTENEENLPDILFNWNK